MPTRRGIDGITIVAVIFFLFLGFNFLRDWGSNVTVARGAENTRLEPPPDTLSLYGIGVEAAVGGVETVLEEPEPAVEYDPAEFTAPYDDYQITQGPHGFSYGHMAIDLAAGKGANVLSPINGLVTELYIDQYGNPTLVIENEFYRVTLLHGDYLVNQGDLVRAGQKVGTESNHGYTTDLNGIPCRGRDCGYHSHLNVYDKRVGTNVNPLDLIER